MVVEIDSLLRPASRTTYKNRKRPQHDSSPAPKKRFRVFRDSNDGDASRSSSIGGKQITGAYRGLDSTQKSYPVILSDHGTNQLAATEKLAVSPISHPDNASLLSASSSTNVKENMKTLSSPSQTRVLPFAGSDPFSATKPFPLSSPFKGRTSRNNRKYGPATISSTARQSRTNSTQKSLTARRSSFKQSRIPTIQSAGIHSSKSKQRTASSKLTEAAERSRAASWLIPPAYTGVSRSLASQAATPVPVDQEQNDCRSHTPQSEEDEPSPQSFGMTSFLAGAPDAFSTPVRPAYRKGTTRAALTEVRAVNEAVRSLSPVLTPSRGLKGDSLRSIPPCLLSPSSPSITVIAKPQLGPVESRRNLVAPPRRRAQRTADRLHTASSPLENSPTAHIPPTCSLLPSLMPIHPVSAFGSPYAPASHRRTSPTSPSTNNVLLTPASSPALSVDMHKHHTFNDHSIPHSKPALKNNPQRSFPVRSMSDGQRLQIDIDSDMLSLMISDGLTIGPDAVPAPGAHYETNGNQYPPLQFGQDAKSRPETSRGRKKIKRTISQTDDEDMTQVDSNALQVPHDAYAHGRQANGMKAPNNEQVYGQYGEPRSRQGETKINWH